MNSLVSDFHFIAGKINRENKIEALSRFTLTDGYDWDALDKVFTLSQSGWEKLNVLSLYFKVRCYVGNSEGDEFMQALWELPMTRLRNLVKSKDGQFDFDVDLSSQFGIYTRPSRRLEDWYL